ncbi:phage pre-neck appendage-like protein [[Clostridium] sordellii]|uniref:Phage pre-neck appendage-like protein n=1 Tax=Paraclostridium sordellii TaxID=1505 RepID=A0A0C7R7P6_PARSO|nr:BppU family phage baseplate upper protein [Paeniclostridium sordellii]CEQ04079.1 phage pre-neck appendage-like protein [[Clostridium] sordellii] [Paeniclostridium sordellii]
MLNRKYNLKLDLQFRCNNSNMEFNQFDKNTSDFFMQVNRSGKDVDLSKSLVTLMVIKPNGSVDSQFLEIGENGVYANLKPSLKDVPGDYQCKAIITMKDETVIPKQVFTYTVNEDKFLAAFNSNMSANEDYSLLTDILGRLSSIETDEQQRQVNEAERILNEEARQVSENARVEAELVREHNDADREKAEATREFNEHSRKSTESSRVKAELARAESEGNRVDAETVRVEAEKLRVESYAFMTSDEERRRNEENARIEAESLRNQAEKTRVNEESQRRTTEQARVLKEYERNSKELERESNESERKVNEDERVQAETNRSDRYNNFITDAESAVSNFKAYTSTAKQEEETRKSNELTRIESEDRRVSNETKRISDENTRKANEVKRVEAETNRQSRFNAKISEVDSKVVEVNVAKDTVIANTKEAINTMKEDVANAIAAGTQDLEVKEARKDLKGKTHESLNLRISSEFEGLKESQDMAYATDKGYLVCKETKNGTVKDLKISGRSLVNPCNPIVKSKTVGTDMSFTICNFDFIAGREYTLFIKFNNNTATSVNSNDLFLCQTSLSYDNNISVSEAKGWFYRKITAKANESKWVMGARTSFNGTVECSDFMILEGDHTQNPPSYFEGIASVGNGVDKIEVSSVKADGNILTTQEVFKATQSDVVINGGDFSIISKQENTWGYITLRNIKVEKNTKYYIKCDELIAPQFSRLYITDGGTNKLFDKWGNIDTEYYEFTTNDSGIIFLGLYANDGKKPASTTVYKNLRIVKKQQEYQAYKEDKKPILFKDTDGTFKPVKELRGLTEVCDTIELHADGKYYYHQRTVKNVLNGGEVEKWFRYENVEILTKTYTIKLADTIKVRGRVLCDRFTYVPWDKFIVDSVNYISHVGTNHIYITHNESASVEVFKQWLQTNPITVITELAEEKVFEVNPLFLEAFEGETMVSVDSGVIHAPMEFKLTSSLPNLVSLNQKRIKELENQMVTMFKSVLNGDMRTLAETIYPEDFIEENRPMLLI